MKAGWFAIVVIAVIAYFIGVKFPATGQNLLAKAGM
jgi:hypothetical protein